MLGVADAFDAGLAARAAALRRRGLGALILLVAACNAAMLGLSRLGYSLAPNRQIPSLRRAPAPDARDAGRGHRARRAARGRAACCPTDLEFLVGIYAFGATLAFTIVAPVGHPAALPRARPRPPVQDAAQRPRRRRRAAAAGGARRAAVGRRVRLACSSLHDGARWVGVGWMAFGVALYVDYRTVEGKPVLQARDGARDGAHAPRAPEAEYGSILVPDARHAARRRHHADRRAARRRGERRTTARAAR